MTFEEWFKSAYGHAPRPGTEMVGNAAWRQQQKRIAELGKLLQPEGISLSRLIASVDADDEVVMVPKWWLENIKAALQEGE
jgi:hypothetical protein